MSVMKNYEELPDGFDPVTYLELNPDVKSAGVDPIRHFIEYGKKEGRVFLDKNADNNKLQHILANFVTQNPSHQNAFDLFKGSWSTKFSFEDAVTNGDFAGLQDDRISWLINNYNVSGKSVLELGPLEAAHTYMLEKHGAKILSLESNKGAFIRSLVVKNYFNLKATFLLGDFNEYDFGNTSFDLVVASGVLYHMKDPLQLLRKIGDSANSIFLWTHYFEPDFTKWDPKLLSNLEAGKWDYKNPNIVEVNGYSVTLVKQIYGESLNWSGFCGGIDVYSNWIFRDDIIWFIKQLGFNNVKVSFDTQTHPNGPAFCLLAER